MKAFIWISSCLVFSVLNVILGEATGFRIGSVLFYLIWFYSARAMCKAWDKHVIAKKAEKVGISPFAYIKGEIPEAVLTSCEQSRGNYDKLKEELKDYPFHMRDYLFREPFSWKIEKRDFTFKYYSK